MNKKDEFKKSLHFPTDIKSQQQNIKEQFDVLNTQYINTNNYEVKEYLSYLMAAIYLTYKELYPDLSIYIPFRVKSDDSTIKNYTKELNVAVKNYNSDDNKFDLNSINSDFMAATIVLDHVKTSRKTHTEYLSPDIANLKKFKNNILDFVDNAEEILETGFIDEEHYLKLKKETLEKIIQSTYPEFVAERPISYQTELQELNKLYDIRREYNSFSSEVSEDDINSLKSLLLDLRSRSSDKLEYEILRETAPVVFNSPLIKNALKASFEFVKDSKKPNGFAAIYYQITTPFGPLEVQLQPNKRYYEAKKGSAFHSGIIGKEIDINSFFELVDPKDPHPINFYLNKLDNISADEIFSDIEMPTFESESDKSNYLLNNMNAEKYKKTLLAKQYMSHIKIKDNYTFNDSKDFQKTDDYLLSLAKFISPFMNVCSSGHTSFSTASIHQKNLIGEFTEILRKKDKTTCLRNMLISRLRTVLQTSNDKDYLESRKVRDSLPRDIAREDITQYATRLHQKLAETEKEEPSI